MHTHASYAAEEEEEEERQREWMKDSASPACLCCGKL